MTIFGILMAALALVSARQCYKAANDNDKPWWSGAEIGWAIACGLSAILAIAALGPLVD